ncbi:MAG TPA: cyanophycin synthetase [Gaiellaceae bacterium]|nr:cyanophycin synthetase [Gaiellaceae bacterium]
MDADDLMRTIGAAYPSRTPRSDLSAVDELRAAAAIESPERTVVVVGTNGKTSTAVYLGRLLHAAGRRAGVTVSPHLRRWGERVQIDGEPVADAELAAAVADLHVLAARLPGREALRFFDLVTLAAARVFAAAGVDAAVFEAGIGGRLDATRTLRAPTVVLTGIGLDHTELLGPSEEAILRDKLAVAPRGARVVLPELPAELEAVAREIAAAGQLDLAVVETHADWRLTAARLAATAAGSSAEIDLDVPGRLERHVLDGVRVLLDAAHNPQGWAALAALVDEPFVAVVSIGADRPPEELRPALARAVGVFATTAWAERSLPAAVLAAAIGAETVEDPVAATQLGLERARATGLPLVVFGSTYLLRHAYEALGL